MYFIHFYDPLIWTHGSVQIPGRMFLVPTPTPGSRWRPPPFRDRNPQGCPVIPVMCLCRSVPDSDTSDTWIGEHKDLGGGYDADTHDSPLREFLVWTYNLTVWFLGKTLGQISTSFSVYTLHETHLRPS